MAEIISASIAREFQVVALKKKGGLLTVAMPDPTHIITLDTIESLTNSEVEPVICNEKEFNQLASSLYRVYAYLDGKDLPPNTEAANPSRAHAPVATHNRMSSRHALLSDVVMEVTTVQVWSHHWDYGRRKGFSTAYGDGHIDWSNMGYEFYQDPTTCQYAPWTTWLYWWK